MRTLRWTVLFLPHGWIHTDMHVHVCMNTTLTQGRARPDTYNIDTHAPVHIDVTNKPRVSVIQWGHTFNLNSVTAHSHTHTQYSHLFPLSWTLNPSIPTHVTQVNEWMCGRIEREGERGEKKNDGVCLCQGLMRRVMPWIGCWVRSPWIPLVSKWVGGVWRETPLAGRTLLSSVSQDSAAHVNTLGLHPHQSHRHTMHYHNQAPLYFIIPLFLHASLGLTTHTLITFSFSLQEHIFKLMKSDSYARFLRSNIYQDLLLARKKVSCTH